MPWNAVFPRRYFTVCMNTCYWKKLCGLLHLELGRPTQRSVVCCASAEVPALGRCRCCGWVPMLAGCPPLGTFSAGTSHEACPASKSEVVVRPQISIVTMKMWLPVHMHIKPSGPQPSLKWCWWGRATVWQSTSCWRQLQRGEEALRSRSLLLEEWNLDKELLTNLVELYWLSPWSFILLTALCRHK